MARKIFLSLLLFTAGIIYLWSQAHFINAIAYLLIFKIIDRENLNIEKYQYSDKFKVRFIPFIKINAQ